MLIRELDDQKLIKSALTRSINENENADQYEALLDEFKKQDIYIIIGIFDVKTTIKLFCQVYRKRMYGENYQWIIVGLSLHNFKNIYFDQIASICSYDELLLSLNGTLQTRMVHYSYDYYKKSSNYLNNYTERSQINNFTNIHRDALTKSLTDSYMERFFKGCSSNNTLCLHSTCFHGYAFDLFLTIFNLIGSLIENKKFSCDYNSFERDINWFQIVNEALENISFTGVTVLKCFDKNFK